MNIINEDDIDLETTSVEVARVRADGLGSRRAWLLSLLSLALYILLIGVLFGHAIDFHFSTVVIGHPGDAGGFVWFLRWWPQALLSGHDPFMTNDIWYPVGQDLVWSTSVPFLSFLSYPLTLFLTPIAQYNVVLILVLALDAWYGFRLLKRSSHRFVVAWTAGLLVPFSSYVVGQSLGHLDLVTVFPYLGLLFAIQDLVDAEGPWSTAWARLFIYSIISIYVVIIAETGGDMTRFPTAGHLASWAGTCPGSNESAGRVKSTHTRPGNPYLKGALRIAAMSVAKSHDTYLSARYRRISSRRGPIKAIVALEHAMLIAIWNMLTTGSTYCDLGGDYYTRLNPDRARNRAIDQLRKMGYEVTLTPMAEAG